MREIEFRAWLKRKKEMTKVIVLSFNNKGIIIPNGQVELFENIELMQYTGLKDKNGVKIFEGDIIKVGNYTWVVTFKYGSFEYGEYEDKYGISFDDNDCPIVSFKVEVIGNIYENKELLEVRDEKVQINNY